MSHHAYKISRVLLHGDPPFSALIMAAMRKADSGNYARLREAFPEIAAEAQARYDAPGGVLAADGEAGIGILARLVDPEAFDSIPIDGHTGEALYQNHRREAAFIAARKMLAPEGSPA